MIKLKYNLNPWQDCGKVKNDDSYCGYYCVIFLHNLLNLNEPYSQATEFTDKDGKAMNYLINGANF